MTYDEWLSALKVLEKNKDYVILERLKKEEVKPGIKAQVEQKLADLIIAKFKSSVSSIIRNISYIFSDPYESEMVILNLKKDLTFIDELINLNYIDPDIKAKLYEEVKKETETVYATLITTADDYDYTGELSTMIKRNKVKWSDTNEL